MDAGLRDWSGMIKGEKRRESWRRLIRRTGQLNGPEACRDCRFQYQTVLKRYLGLCEDESALCTVTERTAEARR
jgi:hypothetical protein